MHSLEKGRLILTNGEKLETDVLVAATGYSSSLSILESKIISTLGDGPDGHWLYRQILHPDVTNLAFVGSCTTTFMNPLTQSLQAAWLARVLTNKMNLPCDQGMRISIQKVRENRRSILGPCRLQAIQIQTKGVEYHDLLARDMGFKLRSTGLFSFLKNWFWPAFPSCYTSVVRIDQSKMVS